METMTKGSVTVRKDGELVGFSGLFLGALRFKNMVRVNDKKFHQVGWVELKTEEEAQQVVEFLTEQ